MQNLLSRFALPALQFVVVFALAIGLICTKAPDALSMTESAPGDGLWLRIIGDAGTSNDIAVHVFSADIWCWYRDDCTQAEVIADFSLEGTDLSDAITLRDSFNGLNVNASARQAMDIHWYLILAESGLMTRTEFNSLTGANLAAPQ